MLGPNLEGEVAPVRRERIPLRGTRPPGKSRGLQIRLRGLFRSGAHTFERLSGLRMRTDHPRDLQGERNRSRHFRFPSPSRGGAQDEKSENSASRTETCGHGPKWSRVIELLE